MAYLVLLLWLVIMMICTTIVVWLMVRAPLLKESKPRYLCKLKSPKISSPVNQIRAEKSSAPYEPVKHVAGYSESSSVN